MASQPKVLAVPASDLFRTVADDAVELSVHAQPGAGRTQVVGRHGDALKVRVAAPPEHGKANDALAGVLAEAFGVPAAKVSLVSGASSRVKRFRLDGVDVEAFAERLESLVGGPPSPGRTSARPR
jgi:uncharacterized protein (TIGR00251 family)